MDKAVIYIHGQGGSVTESEYYRALFDDCDVIGFDYTSQFPWDAKNEFTNFFDSVCEKYENVSLVANSIGAFFAMNAFINKKIKAVYFISPVVDMENLILDMMRWANVSESELREKGNVKTDFGQELSWEYLSYVREHPVCWSVPTHILYGEKDNLVSYKTVCEFAEKNRATLTVMKDGEHWFHTDEQMRFLGDWIKSLLDKPAGGSPK